MAEKKYVIFTDIKEFTYKNGLLTNQQVEKMLGVFDSAVISGAEKYNVSIVKSIGDAYLCLSDDAKNAYSFAKYIIDETQKYDNKEKIEIKRIALRSAITYGEVVRNKAMKLDDYFGDPINLASRIIGITPRGKIFCTHEVLEKLGTNTYSKDIGKHVFHGILSETQLYSLSKIENEEILELGNKKRSLLEECNIIVFRSACVSAILSSQPVPFIENFNIIGVHLYMIVKISQKLERSVTLRSGSKICKEVISPIGVGYFGLHGGNTLAKIMLPGIGGYLFSPLSFAITYAMGKVYTAYLIYSISGESLEKSDIKNIFFKQRSVGKDIAKKEKMNILRIGKSFYKDVLGIKKELGYSDVQKDLLKMLKNKKS